jgi:predicted nucleic acid-binding protein
MPRPIAKFGFNCLLVEWISIGGVELFDLQTDHLPQIVRLQTKYQDLPMDFSDAALLVAAQERNIRTIFTVDRDFSIYRIFGKDRFRNLM